MTHVSVLENNIRWIWWNEKTRWPTVSVQLDGPLNVQLLKFKKMVTWVNDTIDNCNKHCEWNIETNIAYFRFRYQRDLMLFMLRWN